MVKECRSTRNCRECSGRHHTTLHLQRLSERFQPAPGSNSTAMGTPRPATPAALTASAPRTDSGPSSTAASVNHAMNPDTSTELRPVLLATAVVRVVSPEGRHLLVRALIDQGSELSCVCESLVQALGTTRRASSILLTGIGAHKSGTTRGKVTLKIQNRYDSELGMLLEAHILPKLTGKIPAQEVAVQPWMHLSGLELADPDYAVPGKIDLLFSSDIYGHILMDDIRRGDSGSPVAQKTIFAWIVSGPTSKLESVTEVSSGFHCARDHELDHLVRQFWAQEVVPAPKNERLSREDAECEKHFQETHSRPPEGRYVVRLPFRDKPVQCGNSRKIAEEMLEKTGRRFRRDPEFHQLYSSFMQEYLDLGHMEQ